MAQAVKRLPTMQETQVRSLVQEVPLEKKMATHSSILAWEIPRTEEPGELQSMGSQSVGHNDKTTRFQKECSQSIDKMQNIPSGLFGFSLTLGTETKD